MPSKIASVRMLAWRLMALSNLFGQSTLLPESLDDYVSDTNPVRVVDVFVDELDLANLLPSGSRT